MFTPLNKKKRPPGLDYTLLGFVAALSLAGALMVYSTSSVYALENHGDSWRFFNLQMAYLAVGFALMCAVMMTDYRRLKKLAVPAYFVGIALLVAVLFEGIGKEVFGARRWIVVGGFTFQPSEFAKFMFFLYMAESLSRKGDVMGSFSRGVAPYLITGGVYAGLILVEPDFGAAFIIISVMGLMLFTGGAKLSHLSALAGGGVLFTILAVIIEPYRKARLLSFLDPWANYIDSGYQAVQSMVAFSLGGLFGQGLGASNQKLFFLPQAHTDFILSIIGEELGFAGVLTVVAGFAVILFRGVRIAVTAPDPFGFHLVMSYTLLIVFQAVLNMAVALSLLPTKGLTLPFLSYGGTSLVVSLGAMGVILSVSRARARKQ
ncbi:MAG: putative lipid II flippase FtsW [Candidatus Dadabacteria bacterium]|nr:putative lipid II flippase FtsW [Candidatus Dadabacteria bacterium]